MESVILLLELVGTLAFSISGALTGLRKNMDIFGVCILGLTTAVGGGVIRDLILGSTPPATFQNPIYAAVAVAAALVLFLPQVRHLLMWDQALFDRSLFWMDTAGLGIFTVMGIRAAFGQLVQPGLFLLVFVGVVTGACRRNALPADERQLAGCSGGRYALYLCQARICLRIPGRGAGVCADVADGGRDPRHANRRWHGGPDPLSLRPLPLESSPCPRLKIGTADAAPVSLSKRRFRQASAVFQNAERF